MNIIHLYYVLDEKLWLKDAFLHLVCEFPEQIPLLHSLPPHSPNWENFRAEAIVLFMKINTVEAHAHFQKCIAHHCSLNVCPPPHSYIENLRPKMMLLGGGAFRRWLVPFWRAAWPLSPDKDTLRNLQKGIGPSLATLIPWVFLSVKGGERRCSLRSHSHSYKLARKWCGS